MDADGRVLAVRYYDVYGKPTLYNYEFFEVRYTYDLAGRETSVSYYDRDGSPNMGTRGYASKVTEYDDLGNPVKESYYDAEGRLTNNAQGYATVVYTYDDLGNLTNKKQYDVKAANVRAVGDLYAYVNKVYDDSGRLVSEEYYDENDCYTNNQDGYAAHFISYSAGGRISEEKYLDDNYYPVAVGGFTSRTLVSEDPEKGTYVMREVNEEADRETSYAAVLQTYDRYDRAIESRYLSADGTPVVGPEGHSVVRREYNGRGKISLEEYLDQNGNPAAKDGVYGIRREYNSFGNLYMETWLDAFGSPSANADGYASAMYDYDLSNSAQVEKYFKYYLDAKGERCAAANGAWGVSTLYYPATLVREITFIDSDGKPVTTTDGYAILEYEEDEYGNRVWEGYFDANHAQVNCQEGYHSVERKFDALGRIISERYADRYNKLTNNAQGVAGWTGYYDDDGRLIYTNRYDQDRMPVSTTDQ